MNPLALSLPSLFCVFTLSLGMFETQVQRHQSTSVDCRRN